MNLGAIFIGVALLVVALPYVMNPLGNERKKKPVRVAPREKDEIGGQMDVLAAIQDLDFDFQTGKVTREDYETVRAQLVLEAAEYLQMKQQEEAESDAKIRARLQQAKASVKCEKCGAEIGPEDLFCPSCGISVKNQIVIEKTVVKLACPICGKSIKEKDLFCTRCGTRVNEKPNIENPLVIK